jgi:hypothetical protein
MAGAGYKLFATGDVLTAAQVNTYLMQQTVMVFASSAARTTALSGVLAEGMVSYLQDTNTLEVYDGSAWVGATGDITGLTAGTGISISSATGPVPTVAIDTAVTADLTTAQTLTNKTLTSPVLTTPSISNIEAKGDILVGTADNTLGIITAGSNGETLVADSSTSTGLRYQANFAAGKNKIINGDFGIWQRGTSITIASGYGYVADRWRTFSYATNSSTISRQSFTAGTAPVSGYEGTFFLRVNSNSFNTFLSQPIEDVRTFAGQTVTVSFWAKVASAVSTGSVVFNQDFGTGGSPVVTTSAGSSLSFTTSWVRYSYTVALPSIAGKTIGTGSSLDLNIFLGAINNNFDIWGVQVEAGSTATAFQTATGTLQGELAACQRYYYRQTGFAPGASFAPVAIADTTTNANPTIIPPVTMRVQPTSVDFASLRLSDGYSGTVNVTNVTALNYTTNAFTVSATVASGLTVGRAYILQAQGSGNFIGFSAEL